MIELTGVAGLIIIALFKNLENKNVSYPTKDVNDNIPGTD